jgi:hypothetical protein
MLNSPKYTPHSNEIQNERQSDAHRNKLMNRRKICEIKPNPQERKNILQTNEDALDLCNAIFSSTLIRFTRDIDIDKPILKELPRQTESNNAASVQLAQLIARRPHICRHHTDAVIDPHPIFDLLVGAAFDQLADFGHLAGFGRVA